MALLGDTEYGDPLAPARRSRSGIFNQDVDPSRDWVRQMLADAEEAKRRREEEQRAEALRLFKQREAAAEAEARQRYLDQKRTNYIARNGTGRDPNEVADEFAAKEEARSWINSPQGQTFMSPGKKPKSIGEDDDPFDYLLKQPDFTERLKGLFSGNEQYASEGINDLRTRGISDRAIGHLVGYLATPEGQKKYRPAGARDYGGPIESVVTGATGSPLLGQLAGQAAFAVPVVGPALGGAESGSRPGPTSGPGLAADALGVVGSSLVMGAGGNAAENVVVKKAVEKFGVNALTRLGIKVATRAGINVAEDVPITAAQLKLMGIDPTSQEGLDILAKQSALSAGAGAAVPLTGATLRGAKDLPLVPEAAVGAGAYAGTKALGGDEEDARLAAATGAGVTALGTGRAQRAVSGAGDAVTSAADRLGLVPEGAIPLGGMIRSGPDGTRLEAEPADIKLGREDPLSAEPPATGGLARELNPPEPPPRPEAPTAVPEADPRVVAEMDDALERARVQTDAKRGPSIPGTDFLDPAKRFRTEGEKIGHVSWLGGENYVNTKHADVPEVIGQIRDILRPLLGDTGPRFAQDAARAAGVAAPPAIGFGLGSLSGDEDRKKQGLAVGLAASAALSHSYSHGAFRRTFADLAEYTSAEPKANLKGWEKAVGIIEEPEKYDLSKLPTTVRKALADLQNLRQSWLGELNAHERAVGLPETPKNDFNSMFHLWDKSSLKKSLGSRFTKPEIERMSSSGIGAKEGPELQRRLADKNGTPINTLREAKLAFPGIKLAYSADPVRLLQTQYMIMTRRMGDATILRGFQSNPTHYRNEAIEAAALERKAAMSDGATRDNLLSQAKMLRDEVQTLKDQGWVSITGAGDGLYSPEIGKFIQDVFTRGRMSDHPLISFLDRGTTELRQLIYTGDLSAWTMQGLMAALQSPGTAIANFHHLAGASLLGEKYLDWFISRNKEQWRKFTLSGGIPGREFNAEDLNVKTLADAPGFRSIESRGFQAFLPIMRFMQWQNAEKIQSLMQKIPAPLRNSYVAPRVAEAARAFGKYGAAGGGAYAADDFVKEHGGDKWEEALAIAMAGGATLYGSRFIEGKLGKAAYDSLSRIDRLTVESRAAKMTNRSSGVMNRPQMGISQKQSQMERIFFRSPAILRNTLIMVKLALFNSGPEGAAASAYLARTGLLTAASLYGAQKLLGEDTSLDPADSDSPFNPRRFGRASLGSAGTVSTSNPYLSLARAVLAVPQVEGDDKGSLRLWTPKSGASGLAAWFEGRTADITGKALKPVINNILYDDLGLPKIYSGPEDSAIDPKHFLPVSLQQAAESGALDGVMPGIDLEASPDYNTRGERILGPLSAFGGGNFTPESRSAEAVRRTEDAIKQQFPGTRDFSANGVIDRQDLNDAQREQFDATAAGQEIRQFKDETRAIAGPQKETEVDTYIKTRGQLLDEHVGNLRRIEAAVADGTLPKLKWRQAYGDEQKRYRAAKDTLEKDYANQWVTDPDTGKKRLIYDRSSGKAREMTVTEYLKRGDHPEDQQVDAYFALYDTHTKADGSIDFDRLEKAQAKFLGDLPGDQRAYVEGRLASFKNLGVKDSSGAAVPLPTLSEYDKVKAAADPFWAVRDTEFTKLQAKDPFFKQFESYSDFRDKLAQAAGGAGLTEDQALSVISRQHGWYRRFEKDTNLAQRKLRGSNKTLDFGLQDFYGRPAVNWQGYIANQFGDTSFDYRGPIEAGRRGAVDARTKARFAERYGGRIAVGQ